MAAAVQFDSDVEDIDGDEPFSVLKSEFGNRIKQYQSQYPDLIPLILYLRDERISSDLRVARRVTERCRLLSLTNGLLVQHNPQINTPPRILLPNYAVRGEVIKHFHDHEFEGDHQGLDNTYEILTRLFWCRGLSKSTADIVARCPVGA
jgi:hypothetical protein